MRTHVYSRTPVTVAQSSHASCANVQENAFICTYIWHVFMRACIVQYTQVYREVYMYVFQCFIIP
jgi:hypothetical protein